MREIRPHDFTKTQNNTDGYWYLHGFFGNPYGIPLLGGIDYWASTTPNSSFVFPTGQPISRTVYAAAFAQVGTLYGAGDGSTTFNLPDKRGRVSAGVDSMNGVAANVMPGFSLGFPGGLLNQSLSTGNLPPYTPSGTVSNGAITTTMNGTSTPSIGFQNSTSYAPSAGAPVGATNIAVTLASSQAASAFNGSPQGGSSIPFSILQPTITCNYILRII